MRKPGWIHAAAVRRAPAPELRASWHRAAVGALGLAAALSCAAQQQSWLFEAALDGKPIGEHRFVLDRTSDGAQTLTSEARFDVRLLGIHLYRYRHQAQERWQGGCLQSIQADTDDNGARTRVGMSASSGLPPGCVMTFAYWNPAILRSTQLLNAQTGRIEPVQIQALADAPLEVQGKTVPAQRWRIAALKQRIDVWYDANGRWAGLDATLESDRQLRYRLK